MKRCLELAAKGLGEVAPNPMVGCVIVNNGKVIAEGYHEQYGKAHAEVNAINSVANKDLLKKSSLYVSLEPCSHHGNTPPCVDLIIKSEIPHVIIGSIDSNPLVSGKGIERLKSAGIKVEYGVLEKECRALNKRFYTYHEKKRPYIILKWAQTKDGFIDKVRTVNEVGKQLKISSDAATLLVHQWRSQEQSIMIGTNTAILDNPQLNVRNTHGKNPLRIVIDKDLKIPQHAHLLDGSTSTLVFTTLKKENINNTEYISLPYNNFSIEAILAQLYLKNIQSLLVEGGTQLINSFQQQNLWDEARVIVSENSIYNGVKAPEPMDVSPVDEQKIGGDTILYYRNK